MSAGLTSAHVEAIEQAVTHAANVYMVESARSENAGSDARRTAHADSATAWARTSNLLGEAVAILKPQVSA